MVQIVQKDPVVSLITAMIQATFANRAGKIGEVVLPLGMFANVIDAGRGRGIAIGIDGVGTKLKVAQAMGKYDTIGIDCVAMNVNDVLCVGAEPLTMIIYIASELVDPSTFEHVGVGLHRGAVLANVSISFFKASHQPEIIDDIDLVGTCVGAVPLSRVIDGSGIIPGDIVVGLASSGLHSNGYSLTREIFFNTVKWKLRRYVPEFRRYLGEELLEPTRIYVKPVLSMFEAGISPKFMAHITGGGLLNLRRCVAEVGFVIEQWPDVTSVFHLIQKLGKLPDSQMFHTFNMGIGFCVVVAAQEVEQLQLIAKQHGIDTFLLGHAVADPERKITIPSRRLVSHGTEFISAP